MKKILLFIAILFTVQCFGIDSKKETVLSQLAEINSYWLQFNPKIKGLQDEYTFTTEQQKIQTHLLYVEKHLRALPTPLLSKTQIQRRLASLDILYQYAKKGLFPINTHQPGQRVPYFIDDIHTPCAVGHLIIETGFADVAQKINSENNYGYIKDLVKAYPSITDWANSYGFSVDELAWIQPTYSFPYNVSAGYHLSDSNWVLHPTCLGNVDGKIFIDSNDYASSPKPLSVSIHYLSDQGFNNITKQLGDGNYIITITDANNVQTTITDTLVAPVVIFNSYPTVVNNGCNPNVTNGSITLNNVSGGAPPYSFYFDFAGNGINYSPPSLCDSLLYSTNNANANLQSGKYLPIIKDANGCKNYLPYVVILDSSVYSDTWQIITPNNCISPNATIQISCNDLITNQYAYDTIVLPIGNHSTIFTNSLGCSKNFNITIPAINWFATATGNTAIACNGGTNNITVGHTSNPNFSFGTFTGEGVFSKTAGTHTFVVVDSLGCIDSTIIVLTEPDAITNTITTFPIACNGDSTFIGYNTNGGTAPFTYNYNFGIMMPAGNYIVQTTDANGCTFTNAIVISQPSPINNQTNYSPILCNGGTGAISNITTGGTGAYTYDYPNGTLITAGIYTIETTDANGCKKNNTVTVVEPSIATSQVSFDPIVCYGESTAIALVTSGATAPYTYNHPNGSLLTAGSHAIVTTDNNGCVFTNNINILQPDSISTKNLVTTQVGGGFSVSFTAQGGIGAYTYVFQKEVSAGVYTIVGVTGALPYLVTTPGKYRVKITDANGCITYLFFEVNFPASIGNITIRIISIYPNPFINTITIDGIDANSIGDKIEIFDMIGKKIAEKNITNTKMTFAFSNIAKGIYVLKVGNEVFTIHKE